MKGGLLAIPRPRAMRLLWTLVAVGAIGLLGGGVILWVTLGATEADTYTFCVDRNGHIRLLSDSAKPDDAPVECRRNERPIEVPSEQRIADLEATFGALGASLADVLAAIALAQADLSVLQDAATGTNATLADMVAAVASAQGDIAELQDALDGLGGRVTSLESPPTATPPPGLLQQVLDILGPIRTTPSVGSSHSLASSGSGPWGGDEGSV